MRLLPALLVLLACAPAAAASPVIVGGDETGRQWPFMVYLDQSRHELELSPNQYCGGSLIAPTWVMTAAHCITDATLDPILTTVVVGRHNLADANSGERIQARRIIVNESYATNGDDVALIELEAAPTIPGVAPIQIAGPGEEDLWATGRPATVLGWGATSDGGSSSDVLKEAQVPIVGDADCGRAYAAPGYGWRPDIMVCAGFPEGGTDTCQGDSGGPLIVPAEGGWRQVGITSFGEGCAQAGYPGVYAEAAGVRLRTWIAGHVPGAVHAPVAAAPAPSAPPASAPKPAPPARPAAAKTRKKVSRAYASCLKRAGKSRKKQRACARAEARRKKRR